MKQRLLFFIWALALIVSITGISYGQWVSTNGPFTSQVRCFSSVGGNVLAGGFGGIYGTTNSGGTWVSLNGNLTNPTMVVDIAVMGTNVFFATLNGSVYYSALGGNWQSVGPTTGLVTIFGLATKGTNVFVSGDGSFFRSSDNGTNWKSLDPPVFGATIAPVVPSGQNLFGVDNGVYVSTNDGTSWTSVSTGLPTTVTSLLIGGFFSFAGTDNGVFATTNAGVGWAAVNTGMTGMKITTLATNGSMIFAGTEANGVFFSADNGASWKAANSGLPTMKINVLTVAGTYLMAGTDANGVWRRPLSEFNTSSVTRTNQDEQDVSISPNPSTGIFTLGNLPEHILHITLRNILGENILELPTDHLSAFTFDLSKFPEGAYTLSITTPGGVITKKILRN